MWKTNSKEDNSIIVKLCLVMAEGKIPYSTFTSQDSRYAVYGEEAG
jgi:hypothetical protein